MVTPPSPAALRACPHCGQPVAFPGTGVCPACNVAVGSPADAPVDIAGGAPPEAAAAEAVTARPRVPNPAGSTDPLVWAIIGVGMLGSVTLAVLTRTLAPLGIAVIALRVALIFVRKARRAPPGA